MATISKIHVLVDSNNVVLAEDSDMSKIKAEALERMGKGEKGLKVTSRANLTVSVSKNVVKALFDKQGGSEATAKLYNKAAKQAAQDVVLHRLDKGAVAGALRVIRVYVGENAYVPKPVFLAEHDRPMTAEQIAAVIAWGVVAGALLAEEAVG